YDPASSYYVKLAGTEIGMTGSGYNAHLKNGGVIYLDSLLWYVPANEFTVKFFMPNKCYEDLDEDDCGQTLGKMIELKVNETQTVNSQYGKFKMKLVQFGLDYTKDFSKCDKYNSVLEGVYSMNQGYSNQTKEGNICSVLASDNFKQGSSILYNSETVYTILQITELN
ncbi:MAG: hypothetical protein AABY84_03065, partial [Candidatus Firestonebacteria bacterium]